MSTRTQIPLASALLFLLAACATTTFTSTWKAPDEPAVNPVGKTVAAVFVSNNESLRRRAEDILVADLNRRGARGIAAYTILPGGGHTDSEQARARLKEAGAEGVIVMRVVGKDQRITYTPGYTAPAYYNGFGPYWGYGWGTVYQPGYLQTDTDVSVETLVYSLTRDKLLWASTSRTTNPTDMNALVGEVAEETAKQMQSQGFLAK
jgi:hypothetical protein